MVQFSHTESPITLSQIEEIENYIGLKFPDQYKAHLLKYNGGQCTPNHFSFKENGNNTNSCIDWFLAIYYGEYDNLRNYIKIYKVEDKRLPSHILPIAHDPGGNLICISCGADDNGYVYFWDHEKEDHNYSNLFLIAQSFDSFINELKKE